MKYPVTLLALALTLTARAGLIAPYVNDPSTLQLWHMNDTVAPVTSASGAQNLNALVNGATLNNASFSGFGTALSTFDGGESNNVATAKDAALFANASAGAVTLTWADPTTFQFTYEAIVRVDFDPTLNYSLAGRRNSQCQIICGDGGSNPQRIFQFRLDPIGVSGNTSGGTTPQLEFINLNAGVSIQSIPVNLPLTGPDAIVSNGWYHVAVSYNGTPNTDNNLKFYWTLLDPSRTSASLVATAHMNNNLPAGAAQFGVGNTGRNNAPNGNWVGLIDEVRMSRAERTATQMLFGSNEVAIATQPLSQTVVVGQSASFSVTAYGLPPFGFQWRTNGVPLAGATQSSYSIASGQLSDTAGYDVVVTNSFGSVTSAVANLTVRLPLNLTWIGSAGSLWNTNSINWDTNGDAIADTIFNPGDIVIFDNNGSSAPVVLLTNTVNPSRLNVNAASDYMLTTTNGSGIANQSAIVKNGAGTFVIDTDNTFVGPTTIQNGTIQVGNFSGRGSLGSGPLTNNGVLVIDRAGTINFNDYIAGSGSVTNNATNSIVVNGTNLLSGNIVMNAGSLTLNGAQAKGSSTNFVMNATANGSGTTLIGLNGSFNFGPSDALSFLGTTATPDYRCSLNSSTGTNVLNGPINISGDGAVQFTSVSGELHVFTPLINIPAFGGKLLLRGSGNGIFTSQINSGGHVSKTDGGIWVISSTGNSWTNTDVAGGTLRMGAANVFPATTSLNITAAGAVLDLNGFSQQVALFAGPGIVGNSSTTADAVLSVNPPGNTSLFSGLIQNSVAGGTRKLGFTVSGGGSILSSNNTYSGDTTIASGALLELFVNGSISNSANITINDSGTLSVLARTDGTFTINPVQTLKANGLGNISGNLSLNGTTELHLTKSGATLTNDSLNVSGTITYGGALKLDISASPGLTTSDSFKLFNGGYAGSFAYITPVAPDLNLAWDTSTLATDGTLRIIAGTAPNPTNLVMQVSGPQQAISWPAGFNWHLQSKTNSLLGPWFDVPASFTTNQLFIPINPANGSVFYRLIYP